MTFLRRYLCGLLAALVMIAACGCLPAAQNQAESSGEQEAVTTTTTTEATTTTTEATTTTTRKPTTTTQKQAVVTQKPTTQAPTEQSITVYVTKTGKRWHLSSSCNGGTYTPTTKEAAEARGLTPCKKCAGG